MTHPNKLTRTAFFSLMIAFLLGLGASEAMAQRGMWGPDLDRAMNYLTAELDLTSAQQEQIRPIMQEHLNKQQELFSEYGRGTGTPLGQRPEMQQLRNETHSRIEPILTEAQRDRYQQLQQSPGFTRGDRPARSWNRSARGARGPSVDRSMAFLTSELDLTSAQQEQVRPIMQEHMNRQQELFQQYGRGTGTPVGMRPEMQQLRNETHSRVEAVLTESQRERYHELQQKPGYLRGGDRPARGMRRGGGRR